MQFYGRLWFKFVQPRLDVAHADFSIRANVGEWNKPIAHAATMLGPSQFKFLGIEHSLASTGGWNDESLQKLWLYNLHYFEDLNAQEADNRINWHLALLQRWVHENPPPLGNGWEPYPTSLRIVNWVKWSLAGNELPATCIQSLGLQARWLSKRLEIHLLGNHLFANGKALVFAGLYYEGAEANNWLNKGLQIIARELPEQVLQDGGNFERSPMYHAIFLEDVLDLLNIANTHVEAIPSTTQEQWGAVAVKMLKWLQGMSHPDGKISLFNDAAFEIAATYQDLALYAERVLPEHLLGFSTVDSALQALPLSLTQFLDSGYLRLQSPNAVALLDVAPIGPDYLPGHAHADTLSFELSLFGQRVIVNGGTSQYGLGPERLRERQTASHSTVEIDGQSSSEVWGGFRVARRAYPFDLEIAETDNKVLVSCAHNGYRRLKGKPVHRRKWQFSESRLVIEDCVEGQFDTAFAYFHLHPSVTVKVFETGSWYLLLTGGQRAIFSVQAGDAQLVSSHYAPEVGKTLQTQCFKVTLGKVALSEVTLSKIALSEARLGKRRLVEAGSGKVDWGDVGSRVCIDWNL